MPKATNRSVRDQGCGLDGRVSLQSRTRFRSPKYQLLSILANVSRYRSDATMIMRLPVFGEEVVGDRVALTGRAVAVDRDRALPIEVRRRLVAIQIGDVESLPSPSM